jgi:hypothetical protein
VSGQGIFIQPVEQAIRIRARERDHADLTPIADAVQRARRNKRPLRSGKLPLPEASTREQAAHALCSHSLLPTAIRGLPGVASAGFSCLPLPPD